MKLYNLGVNNHGDVLQLWFENDDGTKIEMRANLQSALQYLFNRLSLHDWNEIKNPNIKWGYPRYNIKETMDLLEGKHL